MTGPRPHFASVVDALLAQAERGPDGASITLIPEPGREERLRYDVLLTRAARSAAALAEHGVGRGDRVVLCLPTGPEFTTVFFGAQLLGAVPTAVAVPLRFGGAAGAEGQMKDLVSYLRPAAVVTTATVIDVLPDLDGSALLDGSVLYARTLAEDAPVHPVRRPDGDDLALIQCTSGSTGTPKGVMVTHANLAANCEQLTRAIGWTDTGTTVSWIPHYHDMGLITGLLCPVYSGSGAVLMPPARFLRQPVEWLRHISTYRGEIAAAPNFGYGYATSRVREEDMEGVDLSSWRAALCGAEPVQPDTVRRFVERFTRWGLPRSAFTPGYGMAEAALVVTTTRPEDAFTFDSIDRRSAVDEGRASDVDPYGTEALHVVDCGRPVEGTEVRVVDGEGRPLGEDRIGHLQFRGPSRTVGYFELPEETAACLDPSGWWRTGDVGYLRAGSLRVTGRAKDLVIIRGANYFPSDFEQAAETVPGVRLGAVIAVGHRSEDSDSEELHVIAETELSGEQLETLRLAIRNAVSSRTGVTPRQVHLVPRRSIPKTTSGKLQRSKAREMFVETAVTGEG
ncbi:fatty acyl-AMP ligase [Streptomyces sp. NPDC005438]|uniref:fatty acyl-AMP ligase n=1 Tax=Streptomyces sp. NPDC005438 TaxID=3156880 RepID=UPI00339E00D6